MVVKDFVRRTMEEYRDAKSWKYVSFSDSGSGTTQAVWTPSSGKKVRIAAVIISTTGACVVELQWGTTTFTHLEFNQRRSEPIYLPYDIMGDTDEVLNAYLKADSGTVTVYITVVGEEE